MRKLTVLVRRGDGGEALDIALGHGAMNAAQSEVERSDGPWELVIAYIPNKRVGDCIDSLQNLPDLHVTISPRGYIPLAPPAENASEQVKDVGTRSPIEIFLAGLQSIGSWKGFLTYAFSSGAVVWVGLYTNTSYLLVAAMLISPFGGPAMNAAIATARGDWKLFKQSLVRYFSSIGVTVAVCALLSLIMRQDMPSNLMAQISEVSSIVVVLALTAGIAGASNLVQSERDSLVSAAAVGMLVAASLAPPAGLMGMSLVIGRWDMAMTSLFLLMLTLFGINFSGAIIFRLYGLIPESVRFARGKQWIARTVFVGTMLVLAVLLTIQFWNMPTLQRSTIASKAALIIRNTVEESGLAQLVEANARFTRAVIKDQNTLLCIVYVQRSEGVDLSDSEIKERLTRSIQERILAQGWNTTPVVDISVLDALPKQSVYSLSDAAIE